jgi:hypothetical protein
MTDNKGKPTPGTHEFVIDGTTVPVSDVVVCPVTGYLLSRKAAEPLPAPGQTGDVPPRPATRVHATAKSQTLP